ncbi:hypothetical protein DHEL01_v203244 [Diaporthe helianthi]|uniref:DUF6546 domain-containing protein n=1 Tax=Diaporthe helianthi TaxID=158607 RepID=A0A2P5I783_DIAHE|nr:hypothetical protein DHEL01_v203244 [Diaporthe helianthi]
MSPSILPMDSATPSWALWPEAVRLSILQALLEDGCSLAWLATVSREWQNVIEEHNFARIKVTLPRLASLGPMIRRNRFRVKYIWLCVELERYSSVEAISNGHERTVSQKDFRLFTDAIQNLFKELIKWGPGGELLLDISVYSPSDSNHLFKYLTTEPDTPSKQCLGVGNVDDMDKAGRRWNRWSAASKADKAIIKTSSFIKTDDLSTDDEALDREFEWLDTLPDVPAVTGVLLRQQTRRSWDWNTLLEILHHFPNLQELFYEPWRSLDPYSQQRVDQGYDMLIDAMGSRELEHFSASFMIDASLFFASCRPSWTWPYLTSLALTSQWLDPEASQANIVELLTSAAAVARRMPELQTMGLWNGQRRLATLFQYQSRPATITWRSTWDFALLPSVIPAWEAVANYHGAAELDVKKELFRNPTVFKSHGDAIHYLKLAHPVVRPVSLQQIRMENKVHRRWRKMRKAKARRDMGEDREVAN